MSGISTIAPPGARNWFANAWWLPFFVGILMWLLALVVLAPLNGPARCQDGWASSSIGRPGACSWHGGVKRGESWTGLGAIGAGIASGYAVTMVMTKIAPRPTPPPPSPQPSVVPTSLRTPSHPSPPATPVSGVACPHCRNRMTPRVAKRGRNRGKLFWGCPLYPRCYGTRPYS